MAEGDIVALTDAMEKIGSMQESESKAASDYDAVDSIGKNVTNSSLYGVNKKEKVRANLTSPERGRLKNKMTIFVKEWFTQKKKYEKDTKPATVVSGSQKKAGKAQALLNKEDGEKEGGGLLDWLSGLLGILGLGGRGGMRGLMRMLGKWIWKGVKFAGSKIWGALKGVASAGWNAIKAGFRGVGSFMSGLWSKFKGTSFWKGFTGAISSGINGAKSMLSSAKGALTSALQSIGNATKSAFQAAGSAAKSVASSAAEKGGGALSWLGKKLKGGYQAAKDFGGKAIQKTGAVLKAGKDAVVDFGGKAIQKGGQALKVVKDVAVKGGTAAMSGIKTAGGAIYDVAKKGVALVGKPLQMAWDGAKNYMLKGGGSKALRAVLKRIPFIGAAIEGAFAAYDINKFSKDPESSMEELEQNIGKRVAEGLGGVVLGAALGAALSGPPPFGLGPVGTFLGFMAGDWVGRKIGGMLADHFGARPLGRMMMSFFPGLTENRTQAIQAAAGGDEEAKASLKKKNPEYQKDPEFNDFIWRPGAKRPVSFSRSDIVMGMKRGGPIGEMVGRSESIVDKLLGNTSKTVKSLFGKTQDALKSLTSRSEQPKQKSIFSRLLSDTNRTVKSLFGKTQDTIKSLMSHSKEPKQYTTVNQILNDPFLSAKGNEGERSARIAELQLKAIGVSNTYLSQLVQLTQALVRKPSGGGAGGEKIVNISRPSNSVPATQGDPSGPKVAASNVEFYNSGYSMHTPGTLT